jgi:K+ transporter
MWRKQLLAALRRNAVSPAVYYRLPHDQVVSLDDDFKF